MASEGQHIVNPRTGQEMTFVKLTDGLLRIDSVNPPGPEREPLHVHPHQESGAEVKLAYYSDQAEALKAVGLEE